MKVKSLFVSMLVLLLFAAPAMATQPSCPNVNAIINPGNQTVPEVSVVNGVRIPTVVTLDGANSNPKGEVTCQWTSLSNPAIAIANPNSCVATFNAPEVGPSGASFGFKLTVTETAAGCTSVKDSKTTTINVTNVETNRPPVASAKVFVFDAQTNTWIETNTVFEGETVELNGSLSIDPDPGTTLTYEWVQTVGTTVTLAPNSSSAVVTFTAPAEQYPNGETLKFELTVSDGSLPSMATSEVSVQSVNQPPTANISPTCPTSVEERAAITLDGSGSFDPDQGPLTYQWSQTLGTPNADLSKVDLTASSITFSAPTLTSALDTMIFGLTVTDNGNLSNSATCSIQVLDKTPPVISVPDDIIAEATSSSGAQVDFTVTANDAHDGEVDDVTCTPVSGSTFGLGTTLVNCEATDAAKNTATGSFTVTVQDTTPPVIAAHDDVTAEATSAAGAVVTYTSPATSDVVDGPGTATCLPASGGTFALGDTTVTCNAKDAAGNKATATTFVVHVVDTTPPVIADHGDVTAEATSAAGAVVNYTIPATSDAVDGTGTATCAPASGSSFALGNTTVTCNATDKAGNHAKATTFTVSVKLKLYGFYQPVDMSTTTTTWNTVKNGSTVPLKFEVFAGSTELTDVLLVKSVTSALVACTAGTEDAIEVVVTTTGGTVLRYDTTGGQFIDNWKTPSTAGKCYRVTMTTIDGSSLNAFFKLK